MSSLNKKLLILIMLFANVESLNNQIEIVLNSEPKPKIEDYVTLNIGDKLKIWCKATESIRGMRIEHINFNSYDSTTRKYNIAWQDSLQWENNTFRHDSIFNIYEKKYEYILTLDIKYVEQEHSGWQICYINKHVYRYLYVYIDDPNRTTSLIRKYIKTKPNSKITIPCISPNPEFSIHLLYRKYSMKSVEVIPNNLIFKYNDRIGYQVATVPEFTIFMCCYSIKVLCIEINVIFETSEDENNLMPMFNENYSSTTNLGANLKMECVFINYKNIPISFQWYTPNSQKNQPLINDDKIEVMGNTTIHISTLIVKNVTMYDFGYYKCSVIDFSKIDIGFARRQFFKKASGTYKRNSIKYFNNTKIPVKENHNYTLFCEASYPIEWNYDLINNKKKDLILTNVFINSSFNNITLIYQSILNINLATFENNGYYYCHETHTWNGNEDSLNLEKIFIYVLKDASVKTFPNIRKSKIYIQKHSSYVKIVCIPIQANSFCITYILNQKKFKNNLEYIPFSFEYAFDVAENDLAFDCLCTKKTQHDFSIQPIEYIFIKVYDLFHEKDLPYIDLKYNKNVTVGEELKINCTVLRYCKQCKMNERENVIWSYNGSLVNINQRKTIQRKYIPFHNAELYFSTLVIKHAQKYDSSEYTCSVGDLNSNINVIVIDENILFNYILISVIAAMLILITLIAILTIFFKQVKLQRKIRKVGLSNFNKGIKGILNPKIYINLQADMLPYDTKLEIPRSKIKIGQQLGSGNFGLVFKGEIFGHLTDETDKTVAIKMIKSNLKYQHIKTLIVELKILSILGKHLNIIELLGACTENIHKLELLVIMEYCHYGNIRDILRSNRNNFLNLINLEPDEIITSSNYANSNNNNNNNKESIENINENCNFKEQITTNTLINWSYQISSGMKFIASRKVLHGDLAARNILLNENNIVKICDFGLSKNLSFNYNYMKKTQCPLPIKWMAIESIQDKTFSTQSDVWSFGIVLWEIFSLAQTPYPNLQENMEFFQKIYSGYRMEQPEYSTKEIYQIMLQCWDNNPKRRPSFTSINIFFESISEQTFSNTKSNQEPTYLETCF